MHWLERTLGRARDVLGKGSLQDTKAETAAKEWDSSVLKLLEAQGDREKQLLALVASHQDSVESMQKELVACRRSLEEYRRILTALQFQVTRDTIAELIQFSEERQYSFEETLSRIIDRQLSFARFGDGEFRLMIDASYKLGFQRNTQRIRTALRHVLTQEHTDRLLLGWPQIYRNINGAILWPLVWRDLKEIVPSRLKFGNSHVSRPIMFSDLREEAVTLWRQVWDGQRVCIITGEGSRFEVVSGLFDNLAGHRFLYSTPRNAFDDLPRVFAEVQRGERADIYLLALGPAGTILATELADAGYRAIDVGHISDSYLNQFAGQPLPEHKPAVRAREAAR